MKIKTPSQKYINVVLICLFIIVCSFGFYWQKCDSMPLSSNGEIIRRQMAPAVKTQNSCVHKNDTLKGQTSLADLAEKAGGYTQEDYR